MKGISYYIEHEIINETLIQGGNGLPIDILHEDELLNEFLILCKYADLFNGIEQQWHTVNKSTPTSRAIKEETDKLFKTAFKVFTMISMTSNFDYKKEVEKDIMWYYTEDELRGKKLNTVIRRTQEWKDFYKAWKKFKDSTLNQYNNDAQMRSFMEEFIYNSISFVEDVQA